MAGKSTVAADLGHATGWPVASFGGYVRHEARRRQLDPDRDNLQRLGEDIIKTLGWREFCLQCLRHAGLDMSSVPCIVEGIRHQRVLAELRDLFRPVPVLFVYLGIDDSSRNQRLSAKGVTTEAGAAWERHSTERDVIEGVLADQADLLIDGASEVAVTVDRIISWMRSWVAT